jgi:hypothetical protein
MILLAGAPLITAPGIFVVVGMAISKVAGGRRKAATRSGARCAELGEGDPDASCAGAHIGARSGRMAIVVY